jgi:hypothetical protein
MTKKIVTCFLGIAATVALVANVQASKSLNIQAHTASETAQEFGHIPSGGFGPLSSSHIPSGGFGPLNSSHIPSGGFGPLNK